MIETAPVAEQNVPMAVQNPEVAAMYQAGMHFGYAKTRRHPAMRPYIFGTKSNVEVFDLFKVLPKLHSALDAIREMGKERKIILFVGAKASARTAVRTTANELGMPHVTERWIGGTLTNFKVITERVQYWQELQRQKETGELKKYTKHEQTKLAQRIDKLDYMFNGLETMKRLPHALVVVDSNDEALAIREAKRKNIPVFALSSTDTDPDAATFIIPGNDNAKTSIAYVLERIAAAYAEGIALQQPVSEPAPAEPTA